MIRRRGWHTLTILFIFSSLCAGQEREHDRIVTLEMLVEQTRGNKQKIVFCPLILAGPGNRVVFPLDERQRISLGWELSELLNEKYSGVKPLESNTVAPKTSPRMFPPNLWISQLFVLLSISEGDRPENVSDTSVIEFRDFISHGLKVDFNAEAEENREGCVRVQDQLTIHINSPDLFYSENSIRKQLYLVTLYSPVRSVISESKSMEENFIYKFPYGVAMNDWLGERIWKLYKKGNAVP